MTTSVPSLVDIAPKTLPQTQADWQVFLNTLQQWSQTISTLGTFLRFPQTQAEAGASIVSFSYPEGDIRRYGADATATDNASAINTALSVSSLGGNAAFLPGGSWKIAAPLVAPVGSSMSGSGAASLITVANGVDGLQVTGSNGILPQPQVFRDFSLLGTLSGTTNAAHGLYLVSGGNLTNVIFENVVVQGFLWAAYITNMNYIVFQNCYFQNVWKGFTFVNQSINIWLLNCTVQNGGGATITGPGAGFSTAIDVSGAPEVEALHIQGGSYYGFNYLARFGLIQEVQIEAAEFANATMCAIYFTSVIRSITIRDCFIQSAATGAWAGSGGGAPNLSAIYINTVVAQTYTKVLIQGCEIFFNVAGTGSTGIYIGNGNAGIDVSYNNISSVDIGIGGGNNTTTTGGALNGATIKGNQITATTSSIRLDSLSTELKLGPNYITSGGEVTFNAGTPVSMTYEQPDVPMKGRATFAGTSIAVLFTNPLPVGVVPRVSISGNNAGFCSVTGQSNTGFTINCSVSNTNTTDWSITV